MAKNQTTELGETAAVPMDVTVIAESPASGTHELAAMAPIDPETGFPQLAIRVLVFPDSYTRRDDSVEHFVHIQLINPFPGEDFDNVRLICKWKQDKGVFDYKSRAAFKQTDRFEVIGRITLQKFLSKKMKRKITCPAIYIKNPFFAGNLELVVREDEQSAVLRMLLSELWQIKLLRNDAEDVPQLTAVDSDAE